MFCKFIIYVLSITHFSENCYIFLRINKIFFNPSVSYVLASQMLKKQSTHMLCFLTKPATCGVAALLQSQSHYIFLYIYVALLLSLSRFVRSCFARPKKSCYISNSFFNKTGNVLFSQAASRQVSSALGSLTSVFEMGTGGSSPPLSPDLFMLVFQQHKLYSFVRPCSSEQR